VREADHLGEQLEVGTIRQRVWRVRARRVVHAQGAFERLFTNHDSAYQTALDMHGAGVEVRCVIDSRADGAGIVANAVRAKGIEVLNGRVVVDTRGRKRLAQVI